MGPRIGADDEPVKALDNGLVRDCDDRPAQLLGNGLTKDLDDGPGPAQSFGNGLTKDLDKGPGPAQSFSNRLTMDLNKGPGPAQALDDEPAVHDINGSAAVLNDGLDSELGTGYIMAIGRASGSDINSLQCPLLVL